MFLYANKLQSTKHIDAQKGLIIPMNCIIRTGFSAFFIALVAFGIFTNVSAAPSEGTLVAQKKINQYYHEQVIAKLRNCWGKIVGDGTITFEHSFINNKRGYWAQGDIVVIESTLDEKQSEVALECMRDSVTGTAFSVEIYEEVDQQYVLNWTWPIPLPYFSDKDFTQLIIGGGGIGTGCDGSGSAASCHACPSADKCTNVCVGYKKCSIDYEGGKIKGCTLSGKCASGGPFGLGGSNIFY